MYYSYVLIDLIVPQRIPAIVLIFIRAIDYRRPHDRDCAVDCDRILEKIVCLTT